MLKFDRPTLVTITAPTCSGKSYLLNALTERGNPRIVSTTTRPPRPGEVEGRDYYFITENESMNLEREGKLFELAYFQGTRYAITAGEVEKHLAAGSGMAPIAVLEPHGLEQVTGACATRNIGCFKIYVHTPDEVRLARLNSRTSTEIERHLTDLNFDAKVRQQIIATHTKRVLGIVGEERMWSNVSTWDVIADGTNLDKTLDAISIGVARYNRKLEQGVL